MIRGKLSARSVLRSAPRPETSSGRRGCGSTAAAVPCCDGGDGCAVLLLCPAAGAQASSAQLQPALVLLELLAEGAEGVDLRALGREEQGREALRVPLVDDVRAAVLAEALRPGEEDEGEDEWRPLTQLRPYEERPSALWRSTKRTKGEAVEVAWAPPDHPTARWEAKVIAVRARKAKVRFLGFDASWDTWLPHDSDELFPARAWIPSNPST